MLLKLNVGHVSGCSKLESGN